MPGFELRQSEYLVDFEVLAAHLVSLICILRLLPLRELLFALLLQRVLHPKLLRGYPLILLAFDLDPVDALASSHCDAQVLALAQFLEHGLLRVLLQIELDVDLDALLFVIQFLFAFDLSREQEPLDPLHQVDDI